jgi:hypothetical protein
MPTAIPYSDVRVEGNDVVVSGVGGKALAKSLVQKNTLTVAELANTLGFVHPNQISLDDDGSVRISNPAVAAKITQATQNRAPAEAFIDNNCNC